MIEPYKGQTVIFPAPEGGGTASFSTGVFP